MYFWRMAIESVALVLGFFSYSVIGQIFYDPKVNSTLAFLCLQPVSRKKLNSIFWGYISEREEEKEEEAGGAAR